MLIYYDKKKVKRLMDNGYICKSLKYEGREKHT